MSLLCLFNRHPNPVIRHWVVKERPNGPVYSKTGESPASEQVAPFVAINWRCEDCGHTWIVCVTK